MKSVTSMLELSGDTLERIKTTNKKVLLFGYHDYSKGALFRLTELEIHVDRFVEETSDDIVVQMRCFDKGIISENKHLYRGA